MTVPLKNLISFSEIKIIYNCSLFDRLFLIYFHMSLTGYTLCGLRTVQVKTTVNFEEFSSHQFLGKETDTDNN